MENIIIIILLMIQIVPNLYLIITLIRDINKLNIEVMNNV